MVCELLWAGRLTVPSPGRCATTLSLKGRGATVAHGRGSAPLALLPLREKVARPKAETDEGKFPYCASVNLATGTRYGEQLT